MDTLDHIESHFDVKVIIYDDDAGFGGKIPVSETDKKTINNLLVENVNPMFLGDENKPNDLQFSCKVVVQQDIKYCEDYKKELKTDISEVITTTKQLTMD